VLVIQADAFNRSTIRTVIVAAVTSNLARADDPGNVRLSRKDSRLPRESVVNVSQLATVDRAALVSRIGRLPGAGLAQVEAGLGLVLGL
jgi:mRNA interferase MazF